MAADGDHARSKGLIRPGRQADDRISLGIADRSETAHRLGQKYVDEQILVLQNKGEIDVTVAIAHF